MLLHDAGRLVIKGFQKGLESQYGAVKNSLGDFSNGLSVLATPTARLAGVGGAPAMAGATSRFQPGQLPGRKAATVAAKPAGATIGTVNFNASNMTPAQQAAALTWALKTRSR